MGTPVLLAVVCWLATSDVGLANNVNSSKVVDHISEASAPRLYRNVPAGVYASAAPYGAYSIQFPRFVTAPKTAASHPVPVLHNINGYLRDSYGNRFTGPPHAMTYKSAFPQQFLQIQALPEHLAEPLSASASPFQFQPSTSSQFPGAHFSFPSLQGPTPTPLNHFGGSSQPLVYAGNIRTLASPPTHQVGVKAAQQQPNNQAVFVKGHDHINNEQKFQRLQEVLHNGNGHGGPSHKEVGNPEAAPAQTAITTVVNGKQTVINLETNPPIPQLDLSLLEPLTFANPLVPQVQHFLPRIPNAVYQKLPQANVNGAKNYQKEFVIQKTKTYEGGHLQGKPQKIAPKKKQKKPQVEVHIHRSLPAKPTVIITGTPNGSPEFSYEINSPTYKETYKEKAIKYNKETKSEPVHYSYGKNTQSEPVTYSYTHHSKEPAQIKQVHYEGNGQGPTQLIYTFKPDELEHSEDEDPRHSPSQQQPADSGESNDELEQDAPIYHQQKEHYVEAHTRPNNNPEHRVHYEEVPKQIHNHNSGHREYYEEAPKKPHNYNPEHKEQYTDTAKKPQPKEQYEETPKKQHYYNPGHGDFSNKPHNHPEHREHYKETEKRPNNYNSENREHYEETPRKVANYNPEPREHYSEAPKKTHNHNSESREQYEQAPRKAAHYHPEPREHYEEEPKKPHNYNSEPKEQYEQAPRKVAHYNPAPREHYDEAPKKPYNYNSNPKEQYEEAPRKVANYNPEPREHYDEAPKKSHNYNSKPKEQYEEIPPKAYNQEQRDHYPPRQEVRHEIIHNNPPNQYSQPIEVPLQNAKEFEAITPEYDEDIRLLPTHAPHAPHPTHGSDTPYGAIRVDPNQHVQHKAPPHSEDEPSRDEPQHHPYEREHHHSAPHEHIKANGPAAHIHEQTKLIIMQEETPEEMHSLREQMMAEMIKQEENNEEDFEKAYQNAAIGFPTFEKQALEIEKNIYDPRGYGVPRDHAEYVLENSPFQQYQEEGDDYPTSTRSNYKDVRDKNKDGYYSEYSVARPESLQDRYHKKDDYFKLYKQHKPERYYSEVEHDDKKEEKKSAKYTALPTYSYDHEPEQNKKQFAQYKAAPQAFAEYDYSNTHPTAPRDNSAFASRPHQQYGKILTHFVEPQFHYGFEPISLPRLLDSELSAMASNDNLESEKPGMRKKIYKENWYIKKTSTSGVEPAS